SNDFGIFVFGVELTATISGLAITNGYTYDAAGLSNSGTLTLINCIIRGNTAVFPPDQNSGGGGILNSGNLTVVNCVISENSADLGAGIFNFGTLVVRDSTITDNHASTPPTADSSSGGGIFVANGNATISNSTISNNTG